MADRPDLAAMLWWLARETVAAEEPVLTARELSMWGYTVLLALDDAEGAVRSQTILAGQIGADKTRIIPVLDELQAAGYIERVPDPGDRRVRLLSLTDRGRAIKDDTQAAIQDGEERWLGRLSAADREVFLRALRDLSDDARTRRP